MTADLRPSPPSGLNAAGRRLWDAILNDLAEGLELDARELVILAAACRQADTNSALERSIRRHGVTVGGSKGQQRLNAAVTELRQGRLALARLLGDVDLAESSPAVQSPGSRRAQKASHVRWAEHRARRAVLDG